MKKEDLDKILDLHSKWLRSEKGGKQADLRYAHLEYTDLQGAHLQDAHLEGADLRNAHLQGANLRNADLRNANLRNADLNLCKGLKLYWHVHHGILVENLTEPLKNRILYIKNSKDLNERPLRLKLLKKVKAKVFPTTKEGWEELHKKECPSCPWDGNTIFPKEE